MLINDNSITEIYKENPDDYMEQTGATGGTRKAKLRNLVGNYINARAPRQGLAFNGSAAAKATVKLTNQTIGSDAFSFAMTFRCPTGAVTQGLVSYDDNGSAGYGEDVFVCRIISGALEFRIFTAGSSIQKLAVVNNFTATYGDKVVSLVFSRPASGSAVVYINGISVFYNETTVGGASWQTSFPSAYIAIGTYEAAVFTGVIHSFTHYNCALTAADALEVHELGGAVPERFKFGSQASLITGDASTFASDSGYWILTGGVTISGGKAVFSGAATGDYIRRNTILTVGKRYRAKYTISGRSAGTLGLYDGGSYPDSKDANGSYSVDFTAAGTFVYFINYAGASPSFVGSLDDVTLMPLGAVVHLPLNDGFGMTARDESTNGLDAVLTASDPVWTNDISRPIQAVTAARRNALAPRGGLAFDGTASTRVYSTLTNQNIGTDAFSLVAMVRVPTTVAADTEFLAVAASSTNTQAGSSFGLAFSSSGTLAISTVNAAGTASRALNIAGFISAYGGKTVQVVAVRSANTVTLYVNGVTQTGTDSGGGTGVNWSDSITSTYLLAGFRSSSVLFTGVIYTASLYNLALSQSDVTEIMELGGAVPERFKFGNQSAFYTSDFSVNTNGWDDYAGGQASLTGNIDAVAGVDNCLRISRGTSGYIQLNSSFGVAVAVGRAYRLTFDYYVDAASGISYLGYTSGLGANSYVTLVAGSWQTGVVLEWTGHVNGIHYFSSLGGYIAAGKNLYIKNAVAKRIGAVVHYDADLDGIGYQLHDQSTNKLDAILTTTGVSWTKPANRGFVRGTLTWAGTHEGKSLLGQRCLPANAIIEDCTVKLSANSGGFRLTDQPDAASFIVGTVLTTARKRFNGPSFNLQQPIGTSDAQSNVCVDPDSSPYTGTIDAHINYSISNAPL